MIQHIITLTIEHLLNYELPVLNYLQEILSHSFLPIFFVIYILDHIVFQNVFHIIPLRNQVIVLHIGDRHIKFQIIQMMLLQFNRIYRILTIHELHNASTRVSHCHIEIYFRILHCLDKFSLDIPSFRGVDYTYTIHRNEIEGTWDSHVIQFWIIFHP